MDSNMRKTGSSDDHQDREEGEIRLQRAVDPRFEDARTANTDPETGEMAVDILDLLGDRLGSELGLPAMPGGDDDDELETATTSAPATKGAIAFSALEDEVEGADDAEIEFEDDSEIEADLEMEMAEPDAPLEPQGTVSAERQPGARSLADLLANAQVEDDDWSDLAEMADDRTETQAHSAEADLEEQAPAEAEAARWDDIFADDEADEADVADKADFDADMDGDAWPDEMEAEPESELDAEGAWSASPAAALDASHDREIQEPADEDLSLDDLPAEVNEMIGPGPEAPVFEAEDPELGDEAEQARNDAAEADAFGEEWPFRTDTPELEDNDPADMNFEGTDAMTENSMTLEETPEAAPAPVRKGFFGRFKKAAPVAQEQEQDAIAEPVEAEPHSYVEPEAYDEPHLDDAVPQTDETPAPAPEASAKKSRKGLLLATTAIAACVIGAGAYVLGPQLVMQQPERPVIQSQNTVAPAAATSPAVDVTVSVVEHEDDLLKDDGPALLDPTAGLYDPAVDDPSLSDDDGFDDLALSIDEPVVEPVSVTEDAPAPKIILEPMEPVEPVVVIDNAPAPMIVLEPSAENAVEPSIQAPAIIVAPSPQAPVKTEPADIEFEAGLDDPGNGGLEDLFIRDEAPTFTAPAAPVAPVVDLSKYVSLTEFEALQERSKLLEGDIEELREAIQLRDEAMMERDEMLQGAISAAARAENLAMSQNEVLVQVYELGAKMETAESLVVDLSKRLANVEMTDPADRESVEKRMAELDRRVEGVARDVGLVARMAINGGGKIPSTRSASAVAAPVMAEPVFDTGVSTVIAPNADPSKIPGDVKIGQTVPGYGEVLDIIPTSDGGRLVVMEHGSAVLD